MAKVSVYIVIALLSMNAAAVMLSSTGVADDLGLQPSTDKPSELEDAERKGEDFDAGSGIGSTLFGLWATLAGVLESIFFAINPAAEMLVRYGVPMFYVSFVFATGELWGVFDLISFLRGDGDLL